MGEVARMVKSITLENLPIVAHSCGRLSLV